MALSSSFMPISFSEIVASRMFHRFATCDLAKLFLKAGSHDAFLSSIELFQVFPLGYITKLN